MYLPSKMRPWNGRSFRRGSVTSLPSQLLSQYHSHPCIFEAPSVTTCRAVSRNHPSNSLPTSRTQALRRNVMPSKKRKQTCCSGSRPASLCSTRWAKSTSTIKSSTMCASNFSQSHRRRPLAICTTRVMKPPLVALFWSLRCLTRIVTEAFTLSCHSELAHRRHVTLSSPRQPARIHLILDLHLA